MVKKQSIKNKDKRKRKTQKGGRPRGPGLNFFPSGYLTNSRNIITNSNARNLVNYKTKSTELPLINCLY
jgi:hypothetical protein